MTFSTFRSSEYSRTYLQKMEERLADIPTEVARIEPDLQNAKAVAIAKHQQKLIALEQKVTNAANADYEDEYTYHYTSGRSGHRSRNTAAGAIGGAFLAGPLGLLAGGLIGSSVSSDDEAPTVTKTCYSAREQRNSAIRWAKREITEHKEECADKLLRLEKEAQQKAELLTTESQDLHYCQTHLLNYREDLDLYYATDCNLYGRISGKLRLNYYFMEHLSAIKSRYPLTTISADEKESAAETESREKKDKTIWRIRYSALCGLIELTSQFAVNLGFKDWSELLTCTHVNPNGNLPYEYELTHSPVTIFRDVAGRAIEITSTTNNNNLKMLVQHHEKIYQLSQLQLLKFLAKHQQLQFSDTFLLVDSLQAGIYKKPSSDSAKMGRLFLANRWLSTVYNGLSRTPSPEASEQKLVELSKARENYCCFFYDNSIEKSMQRIAKDISAENLATAKKTPAITQSDVKEENGLENNSGLSARP